LNKVEIGDSHNADLRFGASRGGWHEEL
jgi:hypothetical protein